MSQSPQSPRLGSEPGADLNVFASYAVTISRGARGLEYGGDVQKVDGVTIIPIDPTDANPSVVLTITDPQLQFSWMQSQRCLQVWPIEVNYGRCPNSVTGTGTSVATISYQRLPGEAIETMFTPFIVDANGKPVSIPDPKIKDQERV